MKQPVIVFWRFRKDPTRTLNVHFCDAENPERQTVEELTRRYCCDKKEIIIERIEPDK